MASPDPALLQIIREIMGTVDTDLLETGTALWTAYEQKAHTHPALRGLYVKRALLDVRLAQEQPSTDITLTQDVADRQSQRFDHLETMRADCQTELLRIEVQARMLRPSQAGALKTTTPESPPGPDVPDANDPRYTGDPYKRRPYRW